MSLLKKQLIGYIFVVLMIAIIGYGIFVYIGNIMEESQFTNMEYSVNKMSQQLDSVIEPMEYTSLLLLSNPAFLTSLEDLSGVDSANPDNFGIIFDAETTISQAVVSYAIIENFYRVSVFSANGYFFFTSGYTEEMRFHNRINAILQQDWTSTLQQTPGKANIIPNYKDPWDESSPEDVFSVSRSIRGTANSAIIEVQQPYSLLEDLFSVTQESDFSGVCIFTEAGDVLFSNNLDDAQLNYLSNNLSLFSQGSRTTIANTSTGREEVCVVSDSEYTGSKIILIQEKDILLAPLNDLGVYILLLFLIIIMLSIVLFIHQSRTLIIPIQQLKNEMELTSLENLPLNPNIVSSHDEIVSLNCAYIALKDRLKYLMDREIKLQSLHMRASMDALQAQINPHFFYNVLGLISNRAAIKDDFVTTQICGAIASMMRYSANTKQRVVTLKEEMDNLKSYIYIINERFEHKFSYTEDIDKAILSAQTPKMILQPFVENCVNHGFENKESDMKIHVTAQIENDSWRINIIDNGKGFDKEKLETINSRLSLIKHNLENGYNRSEIGGLGIENIYHRLLLFSNDPFLELGNNSDGGAYVKIGGKLNDKTKESIDYET